MSNATATATMKVVIDTGEQRVLYAEAGKDVIDFIFGFVAMPIGSVAKLLADVDELGSVGNVYASVEKLDAAHMECEKVRNTLLPNSGSPARRCSYTSDSVPPPNTITDLLSPPKYECYASSCCSGFESKKGYVKGVSMYTILDDLTIAPASSMLLRKLGVKDLSELEERTVNIGSKEGLEILKAALHSKTVLTDVFLSKQKRARTDDDTKASLNGHFHLQFQKMPHQLHGLAL